MSNRNSNNNRRFNRNRNRNRFRQQREEKDKGIISYKAAREHETKNFKIEISPNEYEKVDLPIFDDESNGEVLLILLREMRNIVIEADLFKQSLGDGVLTAAQQTQRQQSTLKTYRIFRGCLKGDPRIQWDEIVGEQGEKSMVLFEEALEDLVIRSLTIEGAHEHVIRGYGATHEL